ncbi:uncharacterized protein DUF1990 [Rhodococcus sp. OK519]|nr:uncharacterized protein DUF1990 [Rhodococcus sp. OK519]
MRWDVHRRAGLRVEAATPTAQPGTDVLLRWCGFSIPCRVVHAIDEPDRRGFAYGTLTGHPETGEELFCVSRLPDGPVVATVTAFSRPGRWFTRVGGPIGRSVQRYMTRRYLRALAGEWAR